MSGRSKVVEKVDHPYMKRALGKRLSSVSPEKFCNRSVEETNFRR